MDAAFRNLGVHRGVLGNKRQTARLMGLVPKLHVVGGYAESNNLTALGAGFLDLYGSSSTSRLGSRDVDNTIVAGRGSITDSTLLFQKNQGWQFPYIGAFLSWDLSQLVFHQEEPPYGRYFSAAVRGFRTVEYRVQQLFEERRRVLIQLATVPPNEAKSRFNLRLRLEELTAYLNYLSGGQYAAQIEQLESEGWLPPILEQQLIQQASDTGSAAPENLAPAETYIPNTIEPSREVTF